MCLCPIQVMMRVELLYGAAGVVGSLVSGHLFQIYSSSLGDGIILLSVSALLHLLCLMQSIFLLQVSVRLWTEACPLSFCLKQSNWTIFLSNMC